MRKLLSIFFISIILLSCSKNNEPKENDKPIVPIEPSFKREVISTNHVEYRTGNYPVIISVPHGGSETNNSLVIRTSENCPDPNFTTMTDLYTRSLADLIDSVFLARTGKYPYMVIAKIKRTYVDCNRIVDYAIPKGTNGNRIIYDTYHDFLNMASSAVKKDFKTGFLIDIHGHGHAKKEIEIGYLITTSELNMSNEQLSSDVKYAKKSSIYSLVRNNKSNTSFIDLLRGKNSLGDIMYKNGMPCIPHSKNLSPGESLYFNGGYIIRAHCSANSTGLAIDGVQLEFDSVHRAKANRKNTAVNLFVSLEEYMKKHYNISL